MNPQELLKYINNPELLNSESIEEFESLVKNYPYFGVAHMLYLKNLKNISDSQIEEKIPTSAIHIYDRSRLYELLYLGKEEKKEEILIEDPIVEEEIIEVTEKEPVAKEPESKEDDVIILDPLKVRRKIKDGLENMGLNISETIASQLDLSVPKDDDELEIVPETYFRDEELEGIKKKKETETVELNQAYEDDPLSFSDEEVVINGEVEFVETTQEIEIDNSEDIFELEDVENSEEKKKEPSKKSTEYFDINQYDEQSDALLSNDLISKFIKENPRLERANEQSKDAENIDIAETSVSEKEDVASDTLAKLYISQGYLEKALDAYEKLSLKYPEKNTYFASQIEKIKELISKHKNI